MNDTDHNAPNDEFAVEMTDLDAMEQAHTPDTAHYAPGTRKMRGSDSVRKGQGVPSLRLSPKARVGLSLGTILASALLLFLVFRGTLPALLHQTTNKQALSFVSNAAVDVAVGNGTTYIDAPGGTIYALRARDGFLRWHYKPLLPAYAISLNGDIVYLISQYGDVGMIYALHASNGTLLWKHALPPFSPDPVLVKDGIVYVSLQDGVLDALSSSDGTILWHYQAGVMSPISAFLTEKQGEVYLNAPNDVLYVLRANDGSVLWQYRYTANELAFSPKVENGVVCIVAQDGSVKAFRANDGSPLWHYTPRRAVTWSPLIENGVAYVNANNGSIKALRVSDGFPLWDSKASYQSGGAFVDWPVVQNGIVYIKAIDNSVYALKSRNGALLWHYKPAESLVFWPLLVVNGVAYINAQTNPVASNSTLYALNTQNGITLWRHAVSGLDLMHAQPRVAAGAVYVIINNASIEAFRARDGATLWSYKAPPSVFWTLLVVDNVACFQQSDGSIVALRIKNGSVLWQYPAAIHRNE